MSENNESLRQLPWLHPFQVGALQKAVRRTAAYIADRHWGILTEDSLTHSQKMYILDLRGLITMTATLRHELGNMQTAVYYRGQNKAWPLIPTLFREKESPERCKEALLKCNEALECVKDVFAVGLSDSERTALAQHYRCPTNWLDVVDSPQMAAWFAYHRPAVWEAMDNGVGYIMLLAAPRGENEYAEVIDLRDRPAAWLRPHVQQALCIRANPCDGTVASLNHLLVTTYIVPRPLLYQWSAYEALPQEIMFPNPSEDDGLKQSINAQAILDEKWRGFWREQRYRSFS